jgi:hypothetical protein
MPVKNPNILKHDFSSVRSHTIYNEPWFTEEVDTNRSLNDI